MSNGIPQLLNQGLTIVSTAELIAADLIDLLGLGAPWVWGVYDSAGNAAIVPDSVVSMEHRSDSAISSFPVELGGFQSYNKVREPWAIRLMVTKGGNTAQRAQFLQALEVLRQSFDLYSVYTPEFNYPNMNVTHYDLARTAERGAGMITAEMWLEEVRQTATATYTNTKEASGVSTVNGGTVQPQSIFAGSGFS